MFISFLSMYYSLFALRGYGLMSCVERKINDTKIEGIVFR